MFAAAHDHRLVTRRRRRRRSSRRQPFVQRRGPADAAQQRSARAACRIGLPDSSRYNFAPDNFLIIPDERITLTANGHYDITDDVMLNV